MMTIQEHGRHHEVDFAFEKYKLIIERDEGVAVGEKRRTKLDKTQMPATVRGSLRKLAT